MNLSKKIALIVFFCLFLGVTWSSFVVIPIIDSMGDPKSLLHVLAKLLILIILIVAPITFVAWKILFLILLKPINDFNQVTKIISMGNLGQRIRITSRDELGILGQNINSMVKNLVTAFQSMANSLKNEMQKQRDLEIANTKLKELDKLKDEFVSIASHELRTPMTAIKGLISMIFEGDFGPINKDLKDPLNDVASSTDRLIQLVNDMLDVSRIEAGRMKFVVGKFKAAGFINEVVGLMKTLTRQKGINLEISPLPEIEVFGDINKAKQILSNLIGNSIKFTDKGGITVSVKSVGECICISVTDTGLGIDRQDQEKLFTKFTQISTTQLGRPKGTGLGLYISKEMAKKMGGDLWIESSEKGKGSTFIFSFPLAGTSLAKKIESDLKPLVDTIKPV